MERTLRYNRRTLERICRTYRVRRLDLFGSWAKGESRLGSDVDLLVDYDPDGGMTMFRFLDLEEDLKKAFPGHRVDLVSRNGLSPYLKDEILRATRVLYEQ